MRILFLNHNVIGRGTYLRALALGQALVSRGHSVTLMTTSRERRLGRRVSGTPRLRIIQFPDLFSGKLRNGICPWNTSRRLAALREERYDLIHAFDTRPVVIFPALYGRRKNKAPLILDWADWWGRGGTMRQRSGRLYERSLGRFENFFEEHFRKYADGATVISTALGERLQNLGYPASRIHLLRQGASQAPPAPPDREECRRRLRLDPGALYVGYLGALFPGDARLLFDSLLFLKERKPHARLILIGRHGLGLSAKRIPVGDVIESGEVDAERIPLFLGACDLLTLPLERTVANQGRWPSKVGEYFASGRPVVATRVGDLGTIFEQEGIGVPAEDDAESFGRALIALSENPVRCADLAARASSYAHRCLRWDLIAEKLEAFYEDTRRRFRQTDSSES